MNRITYMARLVVTVLFALALTLGLPAQMVQAQASTVTTSMIIPLGVFPVFIPCAAGGAGEVVELGGNLHVLFSTTVDDQGGFHAVSHFQPQGVTGTGLTTGDKYQGTGVTRDQFNGMVGFEFTFVNNFRIIGQGTGNNFLVHNTFHITVNANGDLTAFVDNFSVECK